MLIEEGNVYEYANGVLRNKLAIQDATELSRVEATLTALRIGQLQQGYTIPGRFDLDHLRAYHRFIFQDIYEWAGELRQVDISKGASRFAHVRYLVPNAEKLFHGLAAEQFLRGLPQERFVGRAAYYLGELNALHPFREGNGRAQRLFLSALAVAAGYDLAWERISAERMTDASIQSLFTADNAGFEALIGDIITVL